MNNQIIKTCIFLLLAIVVFGCNKVKIDKDVPKCIKQEIRKKERNPCGEKKNIIASEYLFLGETVYVITPTRCTDQSSEVFDKDCNHLGSIWGWNGNELEGVSFGLNSTFIKTITEP